MVARSRTGYPRGCYRPNEDMPGFFSPGGGCLAAKEGCPARVHSLRGRRDLNGKIAILIRWKESEGRWQVRLDSDVLSLLPANLQRIPDTPWEVNGLMLSPEITAMVVGNLSPLGIVQAACTCRALAEATMVRPFKLAFPRTKVQLTPLDSEWAKDMLVTSLVLLSGGRVCFSEVQTLQLQRGGVEEEGPASSLRNRLVVRTLEDANPQVLWSRMLPDVSVGLAAADDAIYYLEGRSASQLVRLSGTDGTEIARTRVDWSDPSAPSINTTDWRVEYQQEILVQQPLLVHSGRVFMLHSRLPAYAPLELLVYRATDLGVIIGHKRDALGGHEVGRRCCDVDMFSGFVGIGEELFIWDNHSHSKSVTRETIRVFSLEGEPLRILHLPQSSPTLARRLLGKTGSFLVVHNVRHEEAAPGNQLSYSLTHKRSVFEVWSAHGSLLMASPEEVWPSKRLIDVTVACNDDRLVVARKDQGSVVSAYDVLTGPLRGTLADKRDETSGAGVQQSALHAVDSRASTNVSHRQEAQRRQQDKTVTPK